MEYYVNYLNYIEEGHSGNRVHFWLRDYFYPKVLARRRLLVPYLLLALICTVLVCIRPNEPREIQAPGGDVVEPPLAVVDPRVYIHMPSREVFNIDHKTVAAVARLRRNMDARGFQCLAAVHIGIPLRIITVGPRTLINPQITHQGNTISRAHETSAFHPERPPIVVTRFTPVTLTFMDEGAGSKTETFEGVTAHCVLHMLNQFEGRGIY